MASITHDSELLRQPWQDRILEGVLDFRAVHDSLSQPIVFFLQQDGKLSLLVQDDKSDLNVVNLSDKFGVGSSEKVTAIAVSQAKNLDIYLAFATQKKDDTGSSNLWVLPPLSPLSSTWLMSLGPDAVLKGGQSSSKVISKLLLGASDTQTDYPFLAAVVNKPGDAKRDVCRVEVNPGSKTWEWATDLEFPFTIDKMVDFCVGHLPVASGIFGLENTHGKPTLTFAGIAHKGNGPRDMYNVNLPIVANPKSITTTLDEDGFTNLIVCGDGILHIASQNCVDSAPLGTVHPATVSHDTLKGIHKVEAAQQGRSVALWALNGEENLVGLSGRLELNDDEGYDEFKGTTTPVPLFPNGDRLQTYGVITHPKTKSQQVLCLKEDNSISRLCQTGDSKLWSEQALRVSDPTKVEDVNMYSSQIRIQIQDGQEKVPEIPTEVELASSSQVTCLANGRQVTLSSTTARVKLDSRGMVQLSIRAPDLVAPTITVKAQGCKPVTFNPATKAISKFSATARAGKLSDSRKPDGSAVFPKANEKMSKAIVELSDKFMEKTPGDSWAAAGHAESAISNMEVNTGNGILWQFWHGIVSGVESIVNFAYKAGVFIVETAKKVWKFIVETAEQALAALSGLLKLLEAAVEDVLVWLAEKMDWESITDIVTVLNEGFSTGLDMVQGMIADGGDHIDGVFEAIEAKVGSWHLPPEMPEKLASLRPKSKDEGSDKGSMVNNPAFSWVSNTMESSQNRGSDGRTSSGSVDETSFADVLKSIYDEVFKPIWDTVKSTFSHLGEDAMKLLDPNDPTSWQDILKNLGVDVLLGIIRALRKAVHGVLAVSGKFIAWIKSIMSKPLDIWVISKVYRKVTGRQLTMMDLGALIFAVPTVWMLRLFGARPRDFEPFVHLLNDIKARNARRSHGVSALHVTTSTFGIMSQESMELRQLPSTNEESKGESKGDEQTMMVFNTQLAGLGGVQTKAVANNAVSKTDAKADERLDDDWENMTGFEQFHAFCTWLFRGLGAIKTVIKCVYTAMDTVHAGFTWKRLGDGIPYDDGGWKKGRAVYTACVMVMAGIPVNKLNRSAEAIAGRFWAWGITGGINIYKAGLPVPLKPPLAALAAGVDLLFYAKILIVEGFDDTDQTDTFLEWSNRLLVNLWALGSGLNGVTGGTHPVLFGGTVAVGVIMNLEGIALAKLKWDYFRDNGWKKEYHPPSLETSLSGSLS